MTLRDVLRRLAQLETRMDSETKPPAFDGPQPTRMEVIEALALMADKMSASYARRYRGLVVRELARGDFGAPDSEGCALHTRSEAEIAAHLRSHVAKYWGALEPISDTEFEAWISDDAREGPVLTKLTRELFDDLRRREGLATTGAAGTKAHAHHRARQQGDGRRA